MERVTIVGMGMGGAGTLTVAALGAEGESTISGLEHIRRGYEDLKGDLAALGADIRQTDT